MTGAVAATDKIPAGAAFQPWVSCDEYLKLTERTNEHDYLAVGGECLMGRGSRADRRVS